MTQVEGEESIQAGTRLRQDAEEIRYGSSRSWRQRSRDNLLRRLSIGIALVAGLAGATFLTSHGGRREAIDTVALAWLSNASEAPQIYRLPPPPPKVDLPEIVVGQIGPAPSTPVVPRTVPVGGAVAVYSRGEADREEPYVAPAKDALFEQAFALLETESEVVRKLSAGEIPDLRLEGWDPIKAEPPIYWISLRVQNSATGQTINLAWSIDVEAAEAQPQNQAARDLFFKMRRRGS